MQQQDHGILYFITAHGYGHGVRSCDILNALYRAAPAWPVTVVTDLPVSFLRTRLVNPGIRFISGGYDVGLVQLDSVRADVNASLQKMNELYASRSTLLTHLKKKITQLRPAVVVADIPWLPLQAAYECGVKGVAIGNFTWSWIYEDFSDPGWAKHIEWIDRCYARADLLLRLPFAEPMNIFRDKQNLPLLAQPAKERRNELAKCYGLDLDKRWILLAFAELEWDAQVLSRCLSIKDTCFLTVPPLQFSVPNFCAVAREQFPFADVLASVDIVVSKPGYGVVSECVVNDKPLIYAERRNFREYPILVAGIQLYLRHAMLTEEQLYKGDLEDALNALSEPPPALAPRGGDSEAAKILISFCKKG